MIEKLDIYNKNKEKTGRTIERKLDEKLEKGEYIKSIQCWIINSCGNILITQRNLNKKHGGMWEPTGGLVISGEDSIQGVKRELLEEIGINVLESELELCKEIIEEGENFNFLRDIIY